MQERPRYSDPDAGGVAGHTTVRATCPDCGDVRFPAGVLAIHIDAASAASHLSYPCPRCGGRNTPRVPLALVERLRRAGVPVLTLTRPAEVDEPRFGPPISDADVAAFVSALNRPDWEDELAG